MKDKKRCIYCMSEIDINATVCPNCRRKQKKTNLGLILSLSIGLPIGLLMFIVPIVIGIFEDSNKSKFEERAKLFISTAETQYSTEFLKKGTMPNYQCYSIDEGEFTGSVELDYTDNNNHIEKIWLSNGKYYVSGEYSNLEVVKSNKTATSNCNRY